MEYLLGYTYVKKFTNSPESLTTSAALLPEEVPVVQPLHIHQIMVDQRKIADCNNERDDYCDDRIIQRTHFTLLLYLPKPSVELDSGTRPCGLGETYDLSRDTGLQQTSRKTIFRPRR
jgi:hypothetical protein